MWPIALLLAAPLAAAIEVGSPPPAPRDGDLWVYVGTYTHGGKSRGIYRLALDGEGGTLGEPTLAAETPDPSFLAVGPTARTLYAANEISTYEGKPAGSVTAFGLDRTTGALSALNRQSSGGPGPCHVSVGPGGRALFVANYGGGSVASYPLGEDGRIGPAATFIQHKGTGAESSRPPTPHAHSIHADRGGRFVVAADLGLDSLLVYRLDPATAGLTPNEPPSARLDPGSGPRHFAFHPDGKHAYVINERSSTVTALDYDAGAGTLAARQTISTLPEGFAGRNSTAEIQVHPSGKFLYGSNRGHDSIAIFAIEPGTGRLASLGQAPSGGKTPRNFGIDPSGRFLIAANQATDNLVVFRIDGQSGRLMPTGQVVAVPSPVCVKFVPKGE